MQNQFCLGFRSSHSRFERTFLEFFEGVSHLTEQFIRHCSREAMPDQNPLNYEIFSIRRHGVGRNQPAALAHSIGEIVKGKVRQGRILQFPAEPRDSAMAIVDNLEWTEGVYFVSQISPQFGALCLNFSVAFSPEPEEIVVLADDFATRTGEVESKRRHVSPR